MACVGSIDEHRAATEPASPLSGSAPGAPDGSPISPPAANDRSPKPDPGPLPPTDGPSPALYRLTAAQYRNSIKDLFGNDVDVGFELERDTPAAGLLAVGTGFATVSERGAELYEAAARRVARSVFASDARSASVMSCAPTGATDEACLRKIVGELGSRIFRRPLAADELARFTKLALEGAKATGGAHGGLELALTGLLVSPKFLFRHEPGEPDPARPGRRRYTGHELASRLSFALWNTTPDAALLDAAARGSLHADPGYGAQVKRLIASTRFRDAAVAHFSERLHLSLLREITKDEKVFPAAQTRSLFASMERETLLVLRNVLVDGGGSYLDLADGRKTFVDAQLARLYGLPEPATGFAAVELPADGLRRGLLGHASILAMLGDVNRGSPTFRGHFIRETLLCQKVPAPPENVDTAMPQDLPTMPRTQRERTAHYRTDPGCAGCHTLMDPPGLALEHFDGIGALRTEENGRPVDARGGLDGVEVSDARGLAAALRAHPAFLRCGVRELSRALLGVADHPGEEALVARLVAAAPDVRGLATAIVTSEPFRSLP